MSTADREIVQTRVLRAPRDLVWRAWTEPKHVAEWWGPRGFTNTVHTMEVKPGGVWKFEMRMADGALFPNVIVFKEVEKPARLVYDHGSTIDEPPHFHVVTTFEEDGGNTRVTMRSLFPTAAARDFVVKNHNALEGGKQTLERAEEHLARMQGADVALEITRTFDAPRGLVWKAFTEAEHLAKWWGPKGFDIEVKSLDFRPGGHFHYCMVTDAQTMWGRFSYKEIAAEDLIVFTNAFSDAQAGITRAPFAANFPLEVLNTFRFVEQGNKTTLVMRGVPFNATAEERTFFAEMHKSMHGGFGATFDQLDQYLQRLT